MNDTPLQIAKREMHALLTSRATWIGVGAAGVILGLTGPFGTDAALPLVPRLAYWLFVAALGFGLGSAVSTFVAETLRARQVSLWLAVVLAGAMAGIVNFAALLLINWLVFRLGVNDTPYLIGLAVNVVIISIIIAGAYVSINRHIRDATDSDTSAPNPVRILERLPLEKRGALISLSVQDHYTEVVTTGGSELVLLRLSDAIAEVGDTPGLQVHRSHWVATKAVKAAKRDGARAILTLADGRDIPASRTYIPALKDAGVLPK
ncbi:MAG: LytTR family DNA-binding domain-containing protein [Maritimibacter sp.]